MKESERKLRKFLVYHAGHIQDCLNLGHYKVLLCKTNEVGFTMDIDIDYWYMEAVMRWGKVVRLMWKDGDKKGIVETLCHEFCHLIVDEMDNPYRQKNKAYKKERSPHSPFQ